MYSAVNIIGLAVGLACCLFILLYVQHESSYDQFFKGNERIYRIALERVYPDRVRMFATSPVTLAPTIMDHYPEVEGVTRMHRLFFQSEVPVLVDENPFVETGYYFADSNFFKVFEFEFLEGNPLSALNAPDKVVLTDKTARRFFGDKPALGRTIQSGEADYIISAVIRDLPQNSHLDFDLLGSIQSLGFIRNAINSGSWINPWVYTYTKLSPLAKSESFQEKFPAMVSQHGSADIASRLGTDYAELGHSFNYLLQPLKDIHLHSNLTLEVKPTSNVTFLYLLGVIAFFILLLSCINFVNLTTARSSERAKEVGVRKVIGSGRRSLMLQFILESVLSALFSLAVAIGLTVLLMPYFNDLVSQTLSLYSFINFGRIGMILGVVLLVGILAGLYPAFVISSIDSGVVLKGSYKTSNKGVWLRNGLIVFQFFITLTMISGAMIVKEQMDYLIEKDLGFDKNQVMIIRQSGAIGQNYHALRNELIKQNGITDVGGANAIPGDFMGSSVLRFEDPSISDIRANVVTYDDHFIHLMKYSILEGRAFDEGLDDTLNIIVNEAFAREMGPGSAIGKRVRTANEAEGAPMNTIIGVIEDFNFASLHTEVTPLLVFNGRPEFTPPNIAIRTEDIEFDRLHSSIESVWSQFVPNQNLKLTLLNEELKTLYAADRTTGKVFNVFTLIAILIAFIGLFSLAAYMIQLRMKEISVRKVLGATFPQIFILLSKTFFQLILLALAISIPLSIYGAGKWLEQFAYHIDIAWLPFVQTTVIAFVLVLAAISYQSVRVALQNPGEVLKSD